MKPTNIQFTRGDATAITVRPAVIAHICNDIGAWGRGFVLAISNRWIQPEQHYRTWAASEGEDFKLGSVRFVEVEPGLWVANMIAQRDIKSRAGVPPVRYDALRLCLESLAAFCRTCGASVHMPRIGCGLAGGTWDMVEPIINESLCGCGIEVTVYDLPSMERFTRSPSPQRGETPKPGASDFVAQPQDSGHKSSQP